MFMVKKLAVPGHTLNVYSAVMLQAFQDGILTDYIILEKNSGKLGHFLH